MMFNWRKIKAIKSVTVINPEKGEILEDHDIIIEKDRISGIKPSKKTIDSNDLDVLDGTGLHAIPGIIDSHVHALGFLHDEVPGLFDLGWVMRQQKKNLTWYLRGGVTTVRDMTSTLKLIRSKSKKAAGFKIESPRILYAGPMFTVPDGYPYFIPKLPFIIKWISGPVRVDLKKSNGMAQARKMVDKVAAAGAHCIKIGYQSAKYDDEQTEIPIISFDLIRTIIERAKRHGLPVAIHHVYRRDLQQLLQADIIFDSLEHLTIDEPLSNNELAELARRNIPVSTTLMTYGIKDHLDRLEFLLDNEPDRFEKKPLEFLKRACKGMRTGTEVTRHIGIKCIQTGSDFMRQNLSKLHDAGVKIVYGTDSGGAITPTGLPHWEMMDMVRAGMTPLEVLRSATSMAADVVGIPELGRLNEGAIADIVLLKENPLKNIGAVGKVAKVIRSGMLVHEAVDKA